VTFFFFYSFRIFIPLGIERSEFSGASESRGSAHRKPLIGSIFAGPLINSKDNGPLFEASRSFVKTSKMHRKLARFKPLLVHCSLFADNIALMDACEAMACSAFSCLTLNVKTVFHASPAPKTHYPCD
jgi:hypothetical protein